jgi:hypothetical protein
MGFTNRSDAGRQLARALAGYKISILWSSHCRVAVFRWRPRLRRRWKRRST